AAHLMPDALQDLAEELRLRIAPVHQLAHVGEVHVALSQLGASEDAEAAPASVVVALEGEVHLVDAVPLGDGSELGLAAVGGATEENAVLGLHACSSRADVPQIHDSVNR